MGRFSNFIAAFCEGAKSFGKKVKRFTIAVVKAIVMVVVVSVLLVLTCVLNVLGLIASPVWMPLTFWLAPKWLAKKLAETEVEEPWDLVTKWHLTSSLIFGWIWKWVGTRTWCPRKQRNEFLLRFGKGVKEYSVKTQIEFWEDSVYPESVFRCISEEARVALLKKLLGTNKAQTVVAMMKSYSKSDKGRTVKSLLGAIRDCDLHAYERKQVAAIILNYSYESYDLSMLSSSEVEELWQLPAKDVKLMLCFMCGMPLGYFSRLVCDKDTAEGDGLRVLKAYHSRKTFSDECVSYLIEVAHKRPQIFSFLKEIILRNGISQSNLEKVYATNISTFISEVEEVVEVRAQLDMLRGVASINLPEEERMVENAKRWAEYCYQRQISELAQMKMSKEQYIAFKNAGQELTPKALEHMLVNVNDSEYLTVIIRGEYAQITPRMRTLISAVSWKQRILVDVTAEKNAEEPIEL